MPTFMVNIILLIHFFFSSLKYLSCCIYLCVCRGGRGSVCPCGNFVLVSSFFFHPGVQDACQWRVSLPVIHPSVFSVRSWASAWLLPVVSSRRLLSFLHFNLFDYIICFLRAIKFSFTFFFIYIYFVIKQSAYLLAAIFFLIKTLLILLLTNFMA